VSFISSFRTLIGNAAAAAAVCPVVPLHGQEAYLVFENNPSQENQATLNGLRERIEELYEGKVEGIVVRTRERWHEHQIFF